MTLALIARYWITSTILETGTFTVTDYGDLKTWLECSVKPAPKPAIMPIIKTSKVVELLESEIENALKLVKEIENAD